MTAVLIGVDPGKQGAIAAVTPLGQLLWVEDMPDPLTWHTLDRILFDNGPINVIKAAVELQHAQPVNGNKANFSMGVQYGTLLTFLASKGIPVDTPSPAKWKRDVGLTSDKALSIRKAQEQFPDKAHLFSRKKDDGRAEAALLAYWLSQTEIRGRWRGAA